MADDRPVFNAREKTLNGKKLEELALKKCRDCYGRGFVINLSNRFPMEPCGCTRKRAGKVIVVG